MKEKWEREKGVFKDCLKIEIKQDRQMSAGNLFDHIWAITNKALFLMQEEVKWGKRKFGEEAERRKRFVWERIIKLNK